jgi:hypothetical protein
MNIAIDSDRFPNPKSVVYIQEHLAGLAELADIAAPASDVDLRITCGNPDAVDIEGPALMIQFGAGPLSSAVVPGFWESWLAEDGTVFGLWGKEDKTSPWSPLLTGRFRTQASHSENFHRVTMEPLPHLCTAIDAFVTTRTFPKSPSADYLQPPTGLRRPSSTDWRPMPDMARIRRVGLRVACSGEARALGPCPI